jgi:hypothetical protein
LETGRVVNAAIVGNLRQDLKAREAYLREI